MSLTAAANCAFTLTNTGAPDSTDIYRLSATEQGAAGATAQLANTLAAVKAGQTQVIPVYVTGAGRTVTLKAQSESDPRQLTTATCAVR